MTTPASHVEAPQHTSLSALRNYVLDFLIAHVDTGPDNQGSDIGLTREIAPFNFNTEAQGEPLTHLAIGAIFGDGSGLAGSRSRNGTSLTMQVNFLIGVSYRLRPHDQDTDYGLALDLMQRLIGPLLRAFEAHVAPVNPLAQQLTHAVAPIPGLSPYVRILITVPIIIPVEV